MARVLAVVVLVSLALAACGGTAHLDRVDVERQVKDTAVSLAPNAKIGATSCPANQPYRSGTKFMCQVNTNGLSARWQVVLTAKMQLLIAPIDTVVDVAQAQLAIASQMAARNQSAGSVDCGPGAFRVVGLGARFTCSVRGGTTPTVVVKVVDVSGRVELGAAG
jgi:hypothetical protein